jgi:hypothetical protein
VWKKTGSINKWDCRPEVATLLKTHKKPQCHLSTFPQRPHSPSSLSTASEDGGCWTPPHAPRPCRSLIAGGSETPSTPKYSRVVAVSTGTQNHNVSSQMLEPSNDPVGAHPQTCALQTARARTEKHQQGRMSKLVCNLFLALNELDSF